MRTSSKSNKRIPGTGLYLGKSRKTLSIKPWRIRFVHICLNLVSLALFLRLFQVQILGHEKYSALARGQHLGYTTQRARRGEILDRNKKPLALNEPCYELGFDKRQVKDYTTISKKLSVILDMDNRELQRQIRNNSSFGFIQRKLEPSQAQEIRQEKLPGVVLIESTKRFYPLGGKLAQEIGFVGIDGTGLSGLEYQLDEYLKGEDGERVLQKDATGRNILTVTASKQTNGHTVILTIDHIIQTIIEEELAAAIAKFQAEAGSVIVVNPQNGQILGMASLPGFDANKAAEFGPEAWRIRCVTDIFEPGSTFKIVTLLGAIEEGSIHLDNVFNCEQGKFNLYGETITDHEKYGNLTFREIIINSSNIGTAKIALKIGKRRLFDAARRFGFGNATGIDLPGEVGGIYKKSIQWSRFSVAAISYGYEVAVTPIQMAMAYAAIANDGLLLKPYIVKEIVSPEGKAVEKGKTHVIRKVMQPETAQTIRQVLQGVVEQGTGKLAKIPGRDIAGKTGTAKKYIEEKSRYSDSKYVASFAGFYPVENARFLIHVVLDEPRRGIYGGQVAAPTFRKILHRLIDIYEPATEITQDKRTGTKTIRDHIPDVTGKHLEDAIEILTELRLKYKLEGEGEIVIAQEVLMNKHSDAETVLLVCSKRNDSEYNKVPNLIGKSMRKAVTELSMLGLRAKPFGSGAVIQQNPAAGSEMRVGTQCMLICEPASTLALQ